jgi:uncharacterized protein (TIGR02001 family)
VNGLASPRHRAGVAPCLAALACVAALPGAARGGTFDATLQFTSDYVVRGISQSDGGAVPQAGIQFRSDRAAFAGAWASPVVFDPADGRQPELDVYVGRRWQATPRVVVQATLSRYVYPQDRAALRYDYSEVALQAELDDRVTLAVAWTPDYSRYSNVGIARRRTVLSAELTFRQPLAGGFDASASATYQDFHDLFGRGYWAWGAGFGWSRGPWSATAQRLGSDGTAVRWFGAGLAGPRWAATVTRRF